MKEGVHDPTGHKTWYISDDGFQEDSAVKVVAVVVTY